MTTLSIVFVILLLLNSLYVVFRLRPRLAKEAKDKVESTWGRKANPIELLIPGLLIMCGIALVAVPVVAPTSYLAKWIAEHGIVNYAIWCVFGVVILGAIGFIWKRGNAA